MEKKAAKKAKKKAEKERKKLGKKKSKYSELVDDDFEDDDDGGNMMGFQPIHEKNSQNWDSFRGDACPSSKNKELDDSKSSQKSELPGDRLFESLADDSQGKDSNASTHLKPSSFAERSDKNGMLEGSDNNVAERTLLLSHHLMEGHCRSSRLSGSPARSKAEKNGRRISS